MADSKEMTQSLITAAMAWRVKYRKTDPNGSIIRVRLQVGSLDVHSKNRGGVYPGGIRCKSLCVDVLEAGFVKEEVLHGLVVVEEPPVEHIRSRGEDYVSAAAYNAAACRKDEHLITCFQVPYDDVRHMLLGAQPHHVSHTRLSHECDMGLATQCEEGHLLLR